MNATIRLCTVLPFLLIGASASHVDAATPIDRIEFDDDELDLLEGSTALVSLETRNGAFCNDAQPGVPSNCGTAVSLSFSELSEGIDACFLTANGGCVDTISVGVGGPVGIFVESIDDGASTETLQVRGRFNNFDRTTSVATLHIDVVVAPFLVGPSALRLRRGASATLGFAAQHPIAGGTIDVDFDDVPTGLSVTAPSSVPIGVDEIDVTVAAAATLAAGSYLIDVIASVSGHADQVEPLAIEVVDPIHMTAVRGPGQQFGFKLGTTPLRINVTTVREPGVGAIAYSVPSHNLELNVALLPSPDGSTVRLTVTRGALASPGPATIQLRGTTGGVTTTLAIPVIIL